MKKVFLGLLTLAITGGLAIAGYAVNKSDGCVKLAVPSYLEFEYCPIFQNREFDLIYFDSGKSEISSSESDKLYRLLNYLEKNKSSQVTLIGHTDKDSGIDHEILSFNRAASVELWLKNRGIEEERIRIYGKGHSNPVFGENDREDQAKSRRVEIIID